MKGSSIFLATTMIFTLAACQQVAEKPPKIVKLVPQTQPLPDKSYEKWKEDCDEAETCPYNAMLGMIVKARTYEQAKEAFSNPSYKSQLKRKALIVMLRKARGDAGRLYEVAAYAGPIDKRIQRLARRLEKEARD